MESHSLSAKHTKTLVYQCSAQVQVLMCIRQRTGLGTPCLQDWADACWRAWDRDLQEKADPHMEVQAMERELCTLLNTLAVSLLHEAAGSAEKKEARPVSKGKGKKRAADTGRPQTLSACSI